MTKLIFFIFIISIIFSYNKTRPVQKVDEMATLYALYNATNNTPLSIFNKQETIAAINARLECYKESANYSWRYRVCNGNYIEKIVEVARNHLYSSPDIDGFLKTVSLCPTISNMCRSELKGRCIDFERQCIDYALDTHWRGNILYNINNQEND